MALHQEESVVKFEKLVDSMYKKQRLSSEVADLAKSQYEMFHQKDVSQHKNEFKNFESTASR